MLELLSRLSINEVIPIIYVILLILGLLIRAFFAFLNWLSKKPKIRIQIRYCTTSFNNIDERQEIIDAWIIPRVSVLNKSTIPFYIEEIWIEEENIGLGRIDIMSLTRKIILVYNDKRTIIHKPYESKDIFFNTEAELGFKQGLIPFHFKISKDKIFSQANATIYINTTAGTKKAKFECLSIPVRKFIKKELHW